MNEKEFLRFFKTLATTNADDPDVHAANDCARELVKRLRDANIEVVLSQARVTEMAEEAAFSQQRAVDAELRAERAEAEAERLQRRVDELEAALRDATGYSADPDSVDWPPTEVTP